ncbi:MAG: type 1 glutamine amidotransferase [Thermoanaerobaculia bacterium]
MSRILAVLHTEAEPLGTLAPSLTAASLAVETRLAPEGLPTSIAGYSGLVVMGGPMGVHEAERYSFLRTELELLHEALAHRVPILGVCLGSQLLAAAAGARVYTGPAPEVGWLSVRRLADDPWLRGWPETLEPLHLHGDSFDLPVGAVHLASSALYAHQAFRVGSALGLQFHVEATPAMARAWLGDPGLPERWRPPAGQLEVSEQAAGRLAPLAAALALGFADAVHGRSAP